MEVMASKSSVGWLKKIGVFVLVLALVVTLGACGSKEEKEDTKELKIGITDYPPLNYKDDEGKLIGFETEFAEAVCEKIGYKPKFIEIDWSAKEAEVDAGNIDVIWNGMSWTEERAENMLLSDKYLYGAGVLVVKKGYDWQPTDSVAVEKGAQGEDTVDTHKFFSQAQAIKVSSIREAFLEVKSGTAKAAYVDYIAALGMLGEDSDYKDLEVFDRDRINPTQFALGFKKGNTELADKINKAYHELLDDGTLEKIADKYGLGDLLRESKKAS